MNQDIDLTPNYTPIHVAIQCLEWIRDNCVLTETGQMPRRALDPSAGDGAWCRAMRYVFPGIHITAIEPNKATEEQLKQHADHVIVDTFQPDKLRGLSFDLIATNAPFNIAGKFVEGVYENSLLRPASRYYDRPRNKMDVGGIMALLHYQAYASRSENSMELYEKYPPCNQLNVSGMVSFRPGEKGAPQTYAHYIWPALSLGPRWTTENLPRLPASLRRHPSRAELKKLRDRTACVAANVCL